MRYRKAELHSLSGTRTGEGTCGNGTAAAFTQFCTAGNGDEGLGFCKSGTGAGAYCNIGTGATGDGIPYCWPGNSPDTTCVTGGTPQTN